MAKKNPTLAGLEGLDALGAARQRRDTAAAEPVNESTDTAGADRKETHTQISAYIPKPLYKGVKRALAGRDDKLTLTDLLVDLLSKWEREQS